MTLFKIGGKKQWRSVPQNSHDTQVKRQNPELARHLQNVYRVLISRARRGVYVYFMDKDTEKQFRGALPELNGPASVSLP
jgi:DUF2075 family protein